MYITPELRSQVQRLEQAIHTTSEEVAATTQFLDATRVEVDSIWNQMNFRERYLEAWFGGDKKKLLNYRTQRGMIPGLVSKLEALQNAVAELDDQVSSILDDYLRKHDSSYQALLLPYEQAQRMRASVDSFLTTIDRALRQIGSAQSMETMDLFSKSAGISVLSTMANSDASSMIDAVRREAGPFQTALDSYNGFLEGYQAPQVDAEISDTIDLVFDIVLDGFDFLSIFTLSRLGDAESQLRAARDKVMNVNWIVGDHLNKATELVNRYMSSARSACA